MSHHRDNIGVYVYTGHIGDTGHTIDNIGVYVYTGHWCYIIEITLVYMFILDTDATP